MTAITNNKEKLYIYVEDTKIEQDNHFNYLAVIIQQKDRSQELEINDRIEKALKLYHGINKNFISKKNIKIR